VTIASRVRAHRLWPDYLVVLDANSRVLIRKYSQTIADDLGLTEEQRLKNLPKIAKQSKPRGRPRTRSFGTTCPYCARELVIEV
jgi:hypothetical protein